MLRRMDVHDYRGKTIYMLTLVTEGRQPILGSLRWPEGKPEEAYVEPTPLGKAVERCWESISDFYPSAKPLALQLMPDHMHGLLFITQAHEAHLGQVVKGLKIGCTHAWRELKSGAPNYNSENNTGPAENNTGPAEDKPAPVFAGGYQDSVLTGRGQLERMFSYIADNPRRLALKRLYPDRFRIHDLQLAGRRCQVVGNRFLLDIPDKMAVIVHRRYTPEENARLREEWLACGERGGVLVSAAISPKEKEVLREAMDRGHRIILLRENGFPELYKPSGEAFYACVEGRLLQVSPWEFHMERKTITREQCLELNQMAEIIAQGK